MSASSTHDQIHDLLPEAALGMLRPADLERVLEHTRQCARCAEEFRELHDVVGSLALLAPPASGTALRTRRLRARVLARVEDDRANPRFPAHGWLGWLVAAGLGSILLIHHAIHRPVAYGWLAAGALAIVVIAVGLYAAAQRRRVTDLHRQLRRASSYPGDG